MSKFGKKLIAAAKDDAVPTRAVPKLAVPVLYLIMRNDLPSLNPGKLAAQAAHCANAFVGHVAGVKGKQALYMQWAKETDQFFGTTIVLGATQQQLCDLSVRLDDLTFGLVYDPTYPCEMPYEVANYLMNFEPSEDYYISISCGRGLLLRNELVGAYLFGDKNNPLLSSLIGHLNLYP